MTEILNYGNEIFTYGLVGFIVSGLLYIIFASIIKKIIGKLIKSAKEHRAQKSERAQKSAETSFGFMRAILFGSINALTIILLLFQVKFLATLTTAALGATSILAIVVGFAAQDATANIVGGLFLSFYQPFVKGDLVNIPEKNIIGRIKEIGLRHTTIQTIYNTTMIIPNSIMNSAIIENRQEDTSYTNYLFFSISYDSDVDKAMVIIKDLAINHPLITDDSIKVQVFNLKEYAIELRLIVDTKQYADGFTIKVDLNYDVLKEFKNNNITIPFPTSNVNVSNN